MPEDREDDELLETGEEEVFSRTEVELGRSEHAAEAGQHKPSAPSPRSKP
jgi:hypothetical protein